MKSEIQIKNSAGVCRIEIEGTIGVPEEWQFDQPEARVATYEKFRDTVRRIAGIDAPQIVVDIRSTGGDVNDALLIHDALCSLDAHITTRCYGYTASAATIIAQAASPGCREISANALYLIHTAICAAEGNAAEIAGKLDLLRQTDTLELGHGPCSTLLARHARERKRKLDIRKHRLMRNEVVALEDEADVMVAVGIPIGT